MVAVIKTTGSIKNALNYNENKLHMEIASFIHSMNYGKDTEELGFTDKLGTLQKFISLNDRTKLNSVHISLNFDPSEKEKLNTEMLRGIVESYMQGIGFGEQPYLVYQHHDAGHPHIHVVTTNIRHDGSRIKMHNIGRNQSEKTRKEIESEFKLVRAESHHLNQVYETKPVNVQKVEYGKSETRRAIINVLDTILPTYKYSSLPELNAVLKQYNIVADRGTENSSTFKNKGLLYWILDSKGEKVGIPIKASAIYSKPTLKFLEGKFNENEPLKIKNRPRVRNAIDLSFLKQQNQSLQQLMDSLKREKIQVVLRSNNQGVIYGITYIDQQTKCVFNGSDLGKQYSANHIQQRCRQQEAIVQGQKQLEPIIKAEQKQQPSEANNPMGIIQSNPANIRNAMPKQDVTSQGKTTDNSLLENLMQPEETGSLASELRSEQSKKRKKKKLRQG